MKVSVLDKNLWNKYLAILGVIGIFTSFITIFVTIKDDDKVLTGIIFLTLMIFIFLYIWYQANQSKNINIKIKGLKVNILYGDLFNTEGLKLIPFNEYFDTLVDNVVIAENSLNGKFIKSNYPQIDILDNQIQQKLVGKEFETNTNRIIGKQSKYELGSIVEVENNYLLTAFTHFDDQNRAYLTKAEYLLCLDNLWKEINRVYAQRNINIPLLGSGISRIGNDLSLQDYLEQILNSLKLSDIDNTHDTEINIILHESVKENINLFDIKSNF
jgi:hypothetical protein